MKILITTDHSPKTLNGVVISTNNLVKRLIERGQDVKVLCLSPNKKSYKDGVYYCIKSHSFNIYPNVRASMAKNDPLIDELIEWKPDIIHSQCEFFSYSFAKKIANKTSAKLVHTYHTMYEHYVKYLVPIYKSEKLVPSVMKSRLKNADLIIAPTKKVYDSLISFKINNKIEIIPTGIDISKYSIQHSQDELDELKKQLGIDLDSVVIGSVGRLAKEKNYTEVIKAFKSMLISNPNMSLVLTGDGAYKENLLKLIESLNLKDKIKLPGMISPSQISKYYQILDMFISASTSETQGLTYIEALANGIPVIARRDDAIDGVVENNITGLIFDTTDELISSVIQLANSQKKLKQMKINCREECKKFSIENFGDKILDAYERLLD